MSSYNFNRISSGKLFEAFHRLEPLIGRPVLEVILEDIEDHGIIFGRRYSYSLKQVEDALIVMLNKESALLLVERLRAELENT